MITEFGSIGEASVPRAGGSAGRRAAILRSARQHVTSKGMKFFATARWWLLLLVVVALTGCATNKINWADRVGSYTHDQAITELGPPDKEAKLTDGAVVSEWLTRRGRGVAYTGGVGYYGPPGYYGGFYPTYVQSLPDYFLRLTFGVDGKLTAWKKFAR